MAVGIQFTNFKFVWLIVAIGLVYLISVTRYCWLWTTFELISTAIDSSNRFDRSAWPPVISGANRAAPGELNWELAN